MRMLVYALSSGWLLLGGFIAFLAYVGIARPAWFGKLLVLFGTKSGYDNPFYYFKHWTWKEPPDNWRSKTLQCILWMAVFGALAFCFVFIMPGPIPWPIVAVPALMSVHFLFFALRIYLGVKNVSTR